MSLAVLANQIASKGRNGDSMLVHMSPEEVHGLHALALMHGERMTINPETGLPEAFSLKSLLPMIIGAALNYFVPGLGSSVGGMFGVGQAAGTAIAVGGAYGLAKGSLSEGIQAGLGAYGGAGLTEGLMAAGASEAGAQAIPAAQELAAQRAAGIAAEATPAEIAAATNRITQEQVANAVSQYQAKPFYEQMKGGFDVLNERPGGLMSLAKPAMYAAAPVLADQAVQTTTKMPNAGFAYTPRIRPMSYNPYTGALEQLPMFNAVGAASGGLVALADGGTAKAPGLTMADVRRLYQQGGGSLPVTAEQQPAFQATLSPSSQKIQDYLMGRGPYPVNPTLPAGTPVFKPYLESIGMVKPATTSTTDTTQTTQTTPTVLKDPAGNPYSPFATSYFSANPDVRQAYESEVMGQMSPDAYVQFHWNTFGQKEGRKGYFGGTSIMTPSGIGGAGGGGGSAFGGGAMGAMGVGAMGLGALSGAGTSGGAGDSSGSLSGGIIPTLLGKQDPSKVPVVDYSRPATDIQYPGESLSSGIIPFLVNRPYGEAPAPVIDLNPYVDATGKFNEQLNQFGSYGGMQDYSTMYGMNSGGVTALAHGGDAHYNLGGYSDGGRLLRGPGDGVSDDIPATIGDRQPARLADGEFVVPARIVSELGNGSTEAGARQLYAMMDRVQRARSKTMGEDRVAANTNAAQFLPA